MKKESIFEKIFFYFSLAFFTSFIGLPLYGMIMTSIKPLEDVQVNTTLIPTRFDFGTYIRMWKTVPLLDYIKNSFVIISVSTFLAVFIAIFAGYALQRFVFRGKKIFGNSLIVAQMLPGVLLLLPIYLIFVSIQNATGFILVGSYTGIIITYLTFALPFSIWILAGYFQSIPYDLEEAAFIDGCNNFQVMSKVILPVAKPGIIAAAVYSFILGWEEVLFASILTDESTRTVAVGLRNFSTASTTYWNEMMAAAVIVTLPILILFLIVQKHIISGLTSGGVKG